MLTIKCPSKLNLKCYNPPPKNAFPNPSIRKQIHDIVFDSSVLKSKCPSNYVNVRVPDKQSVKTSVYVN